jgi:hypothetical protein
MLEEGSLQSTFSELSPQIWNQHNQILGFSHAQTDPLREEKFQSFIEFLQFFGMKKKNWQRKG